MANSVSKIAVEVGVNARGVAVGMNQAAAGVGKGMQNVQQMAQQATFAVDDFFAAFATGGVAGGLRGAANNLTMIASGLGGIKAQLAVIAAVTIGGFIAKQFDQATKSVDKLSDALTELAQRERAAKQQRANVAELAGLRPGHGEVGKMGLAEVRAALDRNIEERLKRQSAVGEAEAALKDKEGTLSRLLAGTGRGALSEEKQKALADAKREVQEAKDEIAHQKNLLADSRRQTPALADLKKQRELEETARQKAIGDAGFKGFGQFITPEIREAQKSELENTIFELAGLKESLQGMRSQGLSMWSRLPSALSMGSAGAVGAINQAQVGPRNVQPPSERTQLEIARTLQRIEELEKRKAQLEVVGI